MPNPQTFPLIWTSGPVALPIGPGKQNVNGASVGDAIRLSFVLQAGAPLVLPSSLLLGFVMSRTKGSAPELTLNIGDNPTRFGTFTDTATGLPGFWVDILDTDTAALLNGPHYAAPLDLTTGTGHALATLEIFLEPSPEYTPGIGPALGYRPANTFLRGPTSGAPGPPFFGMIVAADIPPLAYVQAGSSPTFGTITLTGGLLIIDGMSGTIALNTDGSANFQGGVTAASLTTGGDIGAGGAVQATTEFRIANTRYQSGQITVNDNLVMGWDDSGTIGSLVVAGTGIISCANGTQSEQFGATAATNGKPNSVAVGYGAAITSSDTTGGAIAIGQGSQAMSHNSIAIGFGANASTGQDAFALGTGSSAAQQGVAVGSGASAASESITVGYLTSATGNRSAVIGTRASDGGFAQCVVLGYSSTATQNGQFAWCVRDYHTPQFLVLTNADDFNPYAQYSIDSEWVSNVAASRKGRVKISAWDASGAREGVRVESSGSAPMVGFLGANAIARQTTPVTLADVIALLQSFGLCS